jgi:glycerol-3-phosphate dehydrogenase
LGLKNRIRVRVHHPGVDMQITQERQAKWDALSQPYEVLVIGGGIVGAGILRAAAQTGLRALLVEAHDFASGTSSRSSKMVHGGLRYLSSGRLKLTLESVRERQRLLSQGGGLVSPLEILLISYRGDRPPGWVFNLGLMVYDTLALKWAHESKSALEIEALCPQVQQQRLASGFRFYDAQTDDARLVLRVLEEGLLAGGAALNYARVEGLLRTRNGRVVGAQVRDMLSGQTAEVCASVVINATGAWADELRAHVGRTPRLRRLRGSHLFFPHAKFPIRQSVSFLHPADRRPVFAFPWEGVTLVGTTDVDLSADMQTDPRISPGEMAYLMQAVDAVFDCLELTPADVLSTLSGVRSVLDTGKADPSQEARDEVLWNEDGLVTITGGKLTMYCRMAQDTMRFIRPLISSSPPPSGEGREMKFRQGEGAFPPRPPGEGSETKFRRGEGKSCRALDLLDEAAFTALAQDYALPPALQLRLLGRYGLHAADLLRHAQPEELQPVGSSPTLWAELRWAAGHESVVHLDDLLLRRTRLGLLLPEGARAQLPLIRRLCQPELGWDDITWETEEAAYVQLWQRAYSPPSTNISRIHE